MNAGRLEPNQIPIGELEQFLCYVANLKFPDEPGGEDSETFTRRLRNRTEKYWPELWAPVAGEPLKPEQRAQQLLRTIRRHLRLFWREPDGRARDWYIHRARVWHHRQRVMPEVLKHPDQEPIALSELLLDQPPELTTFERALFHLQQRALVPSKAPLYCKNPTCQRPYFLSEKKGTKFCSPECARPTLLASKRNYANNPERKKK